MEGLISAYLAGAGQVSDAIRGLDDVRLHARPADGSWTVLEIVCHLADSEALFSHRMKLVLAEDRPALPFSDPRPQLAALAYGVRDAAEEASVIEAVRRQMARILAAQLPHAWQRVGVHSKEGERTLEQLVRKAVDHLQHHLEFLRAKRRMLE